MLSSIVSKLGTENLAFAENAVDRTFDDATTHWTMASPEEPEIWLFNRCISNLSCVDDRGLSARLGEVNVADLFQDDDSQVRLLFTFCDSRIPGRFRLLCLLRYVCGFTVRELSDAFRAEEHNVSDSLLKGRDIIARSGLTGETVKLFTANRELTHHALYEMFQEGRVPGDGDNVRRDFCIEAMRLTRAMVEAGSIRNHDTFALFALMCIHASRFDTGLGTRGDLLELELQDRSRWDRELIQVGVEYLKLAHMSDTATKYILEGAIASVHSVAESYEDTNWNVLDGLYARLSELESSPMNDLNRCVAMIYTTGGVSALEFIQSSAHLEWLRNYYLYYVVLGKIYLQLGRTQQAVMAYEKALSLSALRAEQDFVHRKLLIIQTHLN